MDSSSHRPASSVHELALDQSMRLLADGRDLRIIGDYGAGKTNLLNDIARRCEAEGTRALHIIGSPAGRQSELLALRIARVLERNGIDEGAVPVNPTPQLILIDDLQWLDDASLAAVTQMRARGTARLAVTISRLCDLATPHHLRAMLRGTWPIELTPLTMTAAADLAQATLNGPVRPDVIQAVTGMSQGNAAVIVSLLLASRLNGTVRLRHGVWEFRSASIQLAGGSDVLLYDLESPAREALTALAEHGLLSLEEAVGRVGERQLGELIQLGRVALHGGPTETRLAVTPPALAVELSARAKRMARPTRDIFAAATRAPLRSSVTTSMPSWHEAAVGGETLAIETIGVTASMLRQARNADGLRAWDRWRASPNCATANDLLQHLLLGGAVLDLDAADRVLSETRADLPATSEDRTYFSIQAAIWLAWEEDVTEAELPDSLHRRAPAASFSEVEAAIPVIYRAREDEDMVTIADVAAHAAAKYPLGSGAHALLSLIEQRAALECQAPKDSVTCTEALADACTTTSIQPHLLAANVAATLLEGRIDLAIELGMTAMESAIRHLDADAVRVHAVSLALCQLVDGDAVAAWRAVSLALRVGGTGPLTSWVNRRLTALGAIALARQGLTRHALRLRDQSAPRGSANVIDRGFPAIPFLHAWIVAEIQHSKPDTSPPPPPPAITCHPPKKHAQLITN